MTDSVFRSLMKAWFFGLCVAALSACGSGGGGGDSLPALPPVAAPIITTQPAAVAVDVGNTASFTVAASGAGLLYQWRRNGDPISNATAATYPLGNAALVDSGARFSVVVTNPGGTVTSADAVLTVANAPTIVTQPASVSVSEGAVAQFQVVAAGTAPLNYQWRKNGVAIAGATADTYTAPATLLADNATTYSVVVSNVRGPVTSGSATLSVFAIIILTQPQDVTVRDTQRATFNVVLSGIGPFTVQWIRNGVDIPTTRLDNVSSTQYEFSLVNAFLVSDNGALYSMRITNAAGSVTTRQALLTVIP